MGVRLVLSTGYMSPHMADFEQYHTLQWERDSVEKKMVHENSGDFLALKSSEDCYTWRHQHCFSKSLSCRLLNAGTCTGKYFWRIYAFYILSEVSATAPWQSQKKGLGRPLGWLALAVPAVLRMKRRDSQKVCAAAGEDFSVWLTSSPLPYWECFAHHRILHSGRKNLRNDKLWKPNNSSVTQELFYGRSWRIWGCSDFLFPHPKIPQNWELLPLAFLFSCKCLPDGLFDVSSVFLPLAWGYFFLSNFPSVRLTVPFPLQMLHFQEARLPLSHFLERTEKMVDPFSCFSIHTAWVLSAWRLKQQLGSTPQDFQSPATYAQKR